ncbi:hypothetical protein F4779DRAFT_370541 [Xylariaceae sp. FL0662B]|nr:hypothetical protein F4779DRAFT_370541 [Xylariaceae sp. FL0662B]
MVFKTFTKAFAFLAASQAVSAHSWVEALHRIDSSGAFSEDVGYPIGFANRTLPDFTDDKAENKILKTDGNPAICKPKANAYTGDITRLSAAPGDNVALLYQENGHVTQPYLTKRPYRGGNVYVYGTLQHEDSDGINDVLNSWTADGKGGNGKGKLLATHFFDDGQCYQDNEANPIWKERNAKHGVPQLWCQTDMQLPQDLPSTGIYTLMWVWDWPMVVSDTDNVTEIYTSCAEIELGPAKPDTGVKVKFSKELPADQAAISSQLAMLIEATGLGVGTNKPAAPTNQPAEPSAAPSAAPSQDSSTATDAPASSTTAKEEGNDGVKTVTVTADPSTTTKFQTVTVGGGNGVGNAKQSETAAPEATASSVTSAQPTQPTSLVPVTSISHFMKARATGQARREAGFQG